MSLVIQPHYRNLKELPDGSLVPGQVLMGVSIQGTLECDPDLIRGVFGVPLFEVRQNIMRLYLAALYGRP